MTATTDRVRAITSNLDDPRHGSRNFYCNYGCRCAKCRAGAQNWYKSGRPTTRKNGKRADRIASILHSHRFSQIKGYCACGFPVADHAELDMHRARMITKHMFGVAYDDEPHPHGPRLHEGTDAHIIEHRLNAEPLCINCLEYMDTLG